MSLRRFDTKWPLAAFAAAFLSLVGIATLYSQDAPSGGALAKVPPDASGFVYVKAGEVWKAEMFAGFRDMILKAGSPAVQAFNKRFAPAPSTIDSLCFYLAAGEEEQPPIPVLLVTFTETFDSAKVLKGLLPNGTELTQFGQKYVVDRKIDVALRTLDSKTLLLARPDQMPTLMGKEAATDGPMKAHFAAAASKTLYAVLKIQELPPALLEQMPESVSALGAAKELVISGQLGKEVAINARLQFADAAAAKAADESAKAGIKAAREQIAESIKELEKKIQTLPEGTKSAGVNEFMPTVNQLFNLAILRNVDELLQGVPLKTAENSLTIEYTVDPTNPKVMMYSTGMFAGLMLPAIERNREASVRAKGQANLKQLAQAMHARHQARGNMPAAFWSKDGKKPLLSWRVALLPYLGQKELYDQFKLDEAWDSEHNKKLIAKIPDVFLDVEAPQAKEPGQTHYQILVGGGAGFQMRNNEGTKLSEILDGTSSTLMIVTATNAVTWTKPEDLTYDPKKSLPKLGFGGKPANVVFFDGSARALKAGIADRTMRAIITRAGGELIADEY